MFGQVKTDDKSNEIAAIRTLWQGIKTLVRVEATRVINGEQSIENLFYISSRLLSASEALNASRGNWSIENELHWVLDVAFGKTNVESGPAMRLRTSVWCASSP